MNSFVSHLKKLDWLLIITAVLLVGIGLVSIYSSSLDRGDFSNLKKQIVFFGIGFLLMLVISFFDYRVLRNDPHLILILYSLCLIALLGLFFFAPEIRGTRGWYKLGVISFDPIEPTKILLLILLAKYFSMRHIEMYQTRHILISGVYVLLPACLIFFQPDLGSVLILIALWIGILLISGIKLRHFLILVFCGFLVLACSWSLVLKDYQKERIISFINPQIDTQGISWSVNQSKIAIGSGGFFGQGLGKGSQTQYGFLTEPQTDFIFASLAEEFGLFGVTLLLFLFCFLIWQIFKIGLYALNNFSRLFSAGFAVLVFSQVFINIGMNLGLLPIIGISLPLVSYGGSNLLMMFIGLGILQSIKTH
ncbi:hypothetical protein AMJ49_04665 [Parcubacteria bacterium DG_74_2]|nr:MAG: hypothetical protein AMJ49_04665 [Parcubacteria bacterium DG_74_2]